MSSKSKPATITLETPVGIRTILEGKEWYEGNGRGHTRDFIAADDGEMECRVCHDELPVTAFPTFSVPRKDGRKRSTECRGCRKTRKTAAAKKAARSAAAKKSAATRKSGGKPTAAPRKAHAA